MFSFFSIFLFSQELNVPAEINTDTQETDFIIANEGASAIDAATEDTGSTFWLYLRMVFALVLVVGVVWAVAYFLRKGLVSKEPENPFIKKAATLTLSPGKSIQVITMPDKAWVVGVSDAGINLIGEITDADLVNQMILEAEKQPQSKPADFASILSAFTNTTKLAESTIKKQRERLKRGGSNE